MTLEERMKKIENIALERAEKERLKAKELEDNLNKALEKIKELSPRIEALITLVNHCTKNGITMPPAIKVSALGYGDGSCSFVADGIYHHVGFMHYRFNSEYEDDFVEYLGVVNGGCCGNWDFYTNGKSTFLQYRNSYQVKQSELNHLNQFLGEFEDFETAFYKWVDSL